MKRVIIALLLLLKMLYGYSQKSSDMDRITIHPIIPEYEELSSEATKLLETKLIQILSTNGIVDNQYASRFVLTAKVNVISKDILVGPPQRISQKVEVTFIIGDIEDDKVYSTITFTEIGIGQSLDKAYISAFKNIKPNHSTIKYFIEESKKEIVEYYELHCEEILNEAIKIAQISKYEEALMMLTSIPNVCENCYNECADVASEIYVDMINVRGAELLKEAQTEWAKNPTKEGAQRASQLLSRINFAATCQEEVGLLLQDITTKMKEVDQREWEFKMQEYKDDIEREKREWAHHLQEYKDDIEREKREFAQYQKEYKDKQERQIALDKEHAVQRRMMINACRDVAIEYARNQPKTVNYYNVRSTRIYAW